MLNHSVCLIRQRIWTRSKCNALEIINYGKTSWYFLFKESSIKGVYKIDVKKYGDNRGYFMKTYKKTDFDEAGLVYNFVQDNRSKSKKGVLRGFAHGFLVLSELTDLGNSFRIRHHETSKIDFTSDNHREYFFNRCLALIVLAIKYIKLWFFLTQKIRWHL